MTKTEFLLTIQYNINQIRDENNEKYQFGDNLIDPIQNYLNLHYKNCMVDSRENCKIDLGVKRLTNSPCQHPSKSIESSMDNMHTDFRVLM